MADIIDLIARQGQGGQTYPARMAQMAQARETEQRTEDVSRLRQQQAEQQSRIMAEQKEMDEIARSSATTADYMGKLLQYGKFDKHLQFKELANSVSESNAKLKKMERAGEKEEAVSFANSLAGVKNQTQYTKALRLHMERFKNSKILDWVPPSYDPELIQMIMFGAKASSESIDMLESRDKQLYEKDLSIIGSVMEGRETQESWTAGRNMIKKLIPESEILPKIPEEMDKSVIGALTQMGQTPQQRMTLQETIRHNKAMEGKPPKGSSKDERLLRIMRDTQIKVEGGEELTKDEEVDALHAEWVLTQPTTRTAPDGKIYQVDKPPLPWKYSDYVRGQQPAVAPETKPEARKEGISLTPLTERQSTIQVRKKVELGFSRIEEIVNILNEAEQAGEEITGILGAAKAKGGGLARQFGANVSDRARNLSNKLGLLQASLVQPLLNEKKITDTERATIQRLVGDVTAATDDVALRGTLRTLAQELIRIDKSVQER